MTPEYLSRQSRQCLDSLPPGPGDILGGFRLADNITDGVLGD